MAFSSMALLVLISLAAGAAGLPRWSWDHVNVFTHCSNLTGYLNPSAAGIFASRPIFSMGGYHAQLASPVNSSQESKFVEQARAIRAIAPPGAEAPVTILAYFVTGTRTNYRTGEWFRAHPDLLLHGSNGSLLPSPSNPNIDLGNPDAMSQLVSRIQEMLEQPADGGQALDGLFLDGQQRAGMDQLASECNASTGSAYLRGCDEFHTQARRLVGDDGVVVSLGDVWPSDSGENMGLLWLHPLNHDVHTAIAQWSPKAARGEAILALHDGSDFDIALAVFLLLAQNQSYFYSNRYQAENFELWSCPYWTYNGDEWSKPIGVPTGNYANSSGAYRREFGSGTRVTVDASGSPGDRPIACILWADGSQTGNCPSA